MKPAMTGVAMVLLLSGCMDMGKQPALAELRGADAVPTRAAIDALNAYPVEWPRQDWWRAYGDAQLTALVERARADSPTVAVAQARVRQAAALEDVAGAALAPQTNMAARSSRQHFSATSNIPKPLAGNWTSFNDASVGLSYEVDFWDKDAAGVRAAAGRVNARMAKAQAATLAVSVALVQAYLELDQLYV